MPHGRKILMDNPASPTALCACAAAKAALIMLLIQKRIDCVSLQHDDIAHRFTLQDCFISSVSLTMVDDIIATTPQYFLFPFFNSVTSRLEKKIRGYARAQLVVGAVLVDREYHCIGAQARRCKECGFL